MTETREEEYLLRLYTRSRDLASARDTSEDILDVAAFSRKDMALTALFIFGDIRRRTFDELRFSSLILRRYETGSYNRSIVGLTNEFIEIYG